MIENRILVLNITTTFVLKTEKYIRNIFKIAKYIDLFMVNPICYFFKVKKKYSGVFYV